jgi:methyl-accepting chemotaxis protein
MTWFLSASTDTAKLAALDKSQAVIEFEPDGTIITANANFLATLGYELGEVEGRHHSMFVEPAERDGTDYRRFWDSLRSGNFQQAEYRRIGKGGREVWIQATYNPLIDRSGRTYRVVKYATDITAAKLAAAELQGQIAAIGKAQAVISFDLDGTILDANDNFLAALGYRLDEIEGRHHRMFVEPSERESAAYREFWAILSRGTYQSGQYKRIGKGGAEVWIQASYNPILDMGGRPFKVVKFATDITAQVQEQRRRAEVQSQIDRDLGGINEAVSSATHEAMCRLSRPAPRNCRRRSPRSAARWPRPAKSRHGQSTRPPGRTASSPACRPRRSGSATWFS